MVLFSVVTISPPVWSGFSLQILAAYQLGHVDAEPMARMRPMDTWRANVEFLSVALYSRILRVVQGQEA
jgi:hypothetical protein